MYASLRDLIDRFGEDELIQLTDRAAQATGVIDDTVVDRALGDADQLIDGYLGGRYALPLDPTPELVVKIACDVARFHLHADRPTDTVKEAYKEAVRLLERMQSGTIRLQAAGIATHAAPAGSDGAVFIPADDAPMFGRFGGGRRSFGGDRS